MNTTALPVPSVVVNAPAREQRCCGVTVHLANDRVEIPSINSLPEFRQWTASASFPRRGRVDYIDGCIEVDMSPEDLYCHGTLTSELHWGVVNRVKRLRSGQTFVKQARLVSLDGNLSAEPDILYVSFDALRSGRIVLRPRANDAERFIEFEGAADLTVEAVSDSSVQKDTLRLPELYYRANVTEFWLADARGDQLMFQVFRRGDTAFEPALRDVEGYQFSTVLDCWVRLERFRDEVGQWAYELKEKPAQEGSP